MELIWKYFQTEQRASDSELKLMLDQSLFWFSVFVMLLADKTNDVMLDDHILWIFYSSILFFLFYFPFFHLSLFSPRSLHFSLSENHREPNLKRLQYDKTAVLRERRNQNMAAKLKHKDSIDELYSSLAS